MVVMATAAAESTAADATARGRERSHAKALMRRRPPPSGCRLHPAWRLAPSDARPPTGKCCPNRVTRSPAPDDRGSGDISPRSLGEAVPEPVEGPPDAPGGSRADVLLEVLSGEGLGRRHEVGGRA